MKNLLLVYAGMRLNGDKRTHLYFKIIDNKLSDRLNFKVQIYPCTPGTTFTIDTDDTENTVYRNTARYTGVWDNEEDKLVWQGAHKAATMLIQGNRKANESAEVQKAVDTLRTAYKFLDMTHRRYFFAWLTYEITK